MQNNPLFYAKENTDTEIHQLNQRYDMLIYGGHVDKCWGSLLNRRQRIQTVFCIAF